MNLKKYLGNEVNLWNKNMPKFTYLVIQQISTESLPCANFSSRDLVFNSEQKQLETPGSKELKSSGGEMDKTHSK